MLRADNFAVNSKERFIKTLSMVLQSNEHTTWLAGHLVKEKSDIDVISPDFFNADIDLLKAFADEALQCAY